MNKVNSEKVLQSLENEFLALSPKQQAETIRKLPTTKDKIAAVKQFVFGGKLYQMAGFLSPILIAKAIVEEQDSDKSTIFTTLSSHSYFPKVWNAMGTTVYPSTAFRDIPLRFIKEMFKVKVANLDPSWEKVEDILSVYDHDGVTALRFALPGESQPGDTVAYKKYERLQYAAEGATEAWIKELFESVSIETKAHLFACLKSSNEIRKVVGLLATYYCAAGIADFFVTVVFGDFSQKDKPEAGINFGLFGGEYSDAVRKYRTTPKTVLSFFLIFKGYRGVVRSLINMLPLALIKQIVTVSPSMKEFLSFETEKILDGNIDLLDTKTMLQNKTVSGVIVKKINTLAIHEKLQLLV
jgi:hypothetical protein